MEPAKIPDPYVAGAAGDVIKPFLTEDGRLFARDFYQEDRVAAQAGALVADYLEAIFRIGLTGAADTDPSPARPPAHCFVVGPDDATKLPNEVMTSPGTIGWNPYGARYRYDPQQLDAVNRWAWIAAGCPKRNEFGEWAHGGVPLGYVMETWKHNSDPSKDLHQPGWPGSVPRGRHRR